MRALLLIAVLLTACETTYREGATITSASGQRLCAKHHTALVARTMWQPPEHGDRVWLVHDANHPYYSFAEAYCPNHIPQHVVETRQDIFQERITIYFCPLCEKEFWQRQSVPDANAAVKFVTGLGATWGRSVPGHLTKGPYNVSFHQGIWIVHCFLDDGRTARIKIAKKDGALVDAKIQ